MDNSGNEPQSDKGKSRQCLYRSGKWPPSCIKYFSPRFFYTDTLLYTNAFSHKDFSRTEAFTHRCFYTQKLLQNRDGARETTIIPKCKFLYIEIFTYQGLYKQNLSPKEGFSCKCFIQNNFIQLFFHTNHFIHKPFLHRHFYIQTLLYTEPFTHRHFYRDTFIQRYTHNQKLFTNKNFHI